MSARGSSGNSPRSQGRVPFRRNRVIEERRRGFRLRRHSELDPPRVVVPRTFLPGERILVRRVALEPRNPLLDGRRGHHRRRFVGCVPHQQDLSWPVPRVRVVRRHCVPRRRPPSTPLWTAAADDQNFQDRRHGDRVSTRAVVGEAVPRRDCADPLACVGSVWRGDGFPT
jgi:hypothetical protein